MIEIYEDKLLFLIRVLCGEVGLILGSAGLEMCQPGTNTPRAKCKLFAQMSEQKAGISLNFNKETDCSRIVNDYLNTIRKMNHLKMPLISKSVN